MSFYHGVEVVEIEGGARPIQTVNASVIGVVGTAPNADTTAFPLNVPVLIAGNKKQAAKLGSIGTLPDALTGILEQVGAMVVVIRVAHSDDNTTQLAAIQGGVDSTTEQRLGMSALLDTESKLGLTPTILIAPHFSNEVGIAQALLPIANQLKAVVIAEAPSTTDVAAIQYQQNFGSDRLFVVDPRVKVLASGIEVVKPSSPYIAGLMARIDQEYGWHCSASNHQIFGIIGTERPIDFALSGACRANTLNENKIATIIHQDGYRLWGNLSCSADPKWQFLCVRRTADNLNASLLKAHRWAVDRGISKTFVEDIVMSVNGYLRSLTAQGHISGGKCWADPSLNEANDIANGHVTFSFDFTPVYPAQHITFNSHMVNTYLKDVI